MKTVILACVRVRKPLMDLPAAKPPERTGGTDLRGLERAFIETGPPEVRATLTARDAAAFVSALGRAAALCNGCRVAAEYGFIEVPVEPGHPVPRLDPMP